MSSLGRHRNDSWNDGNWIRGESCALLLLKVIQDAVQELKLARKDEDLVQELEISLRPSGEDQARALQEKLGPQMLQPLVEEGFFS
eukprot:s3837_g3.t1